MNIYKILRIGDSNNGSSGVFEALGGGSIPPSPANFKYCSADRDRLNKACIGVRQFQKNMLKKTFPLSNIAATIIFGS